MDALEFRYAKGWIWQRMLLLCVVVAFAVLAVYRTADGGGKGQGTWLAAIVLASLGLYAFRGLFDRRPVLLISDAGVWFRGWHLERPIPWGEIAQVRYVSAARGEPFITLELAATSTDRRAQQEFQFRTGELDVENEEALRLVKEYWNAAKQNGGAEV